MQCKLLFPILVVSWVCASVNAEASCKPVDHPNFVYIPMTLAVIAEGESPELSSEVAYLNGHQGYYQLTLLQGNDLLSHIQAKLGYDAVLVFDREMMRDGAPKYNEYLYTYRGKDLSDETMIIDSRFDSQHRIGFTFIQVSAVSPRVQSLLMEIGLMALADDLRLDDELLAYYRKIDSISAYADDQISPASIEEINKTREEIILACFLRGS